MQEDLQAKAEDKAKEAQLDELANLDPSETRFTFEQTSDPVRLKCRSMITQALEVSGQFSLTFGLVKLSIWHCCFF